MNPERDMILTTSAIENFEYELNETEKMGFY